jgi:parallel beta-helix repeat protein
VWVCAGGFATLDNNDIYSNEHACVQIDDAGSEAILRSNRIYDGRTGGVLIANKGNGTLENNISFNNAFCGIQVEDKGSQAMLKGNRVHNGRAGGVLIYVEATATLERNIVTANDLAGVAVDEKSFARLVGNTITNNGACNNEWPDEDLAQWPAHYVSAFRSPDGFPGLMIMSHSTAVMDPGSNTIEGNGREGGSVHADLELQSKVDSTSRTVLPLRVSLRQSRKKNGVAS